MQVARLIALVFVTIFLSRTYASNEQEINSIVGSESSDDLERINSFVDLEEDIVKINSFVGSEESFETQDYELLDLNIPVVSINSSTEVLDRIKELFCYIVQSDRVRNLKFRQKKSSICAQLVIWLYIVHCHGDKDSTKVLFHNLNSSLVGLEFVCFDLRLTDCINRILLGDFVDQVISLFEGKTSNATDNQAISSIVEKKLLNLKRHMRKIVNAKLELQKDHHKKFTITINHDFDAILSAIVHMNNLSSFYNYFGLVCEPAFN